MSVLTLREPSIYVWPFHVNLDKDDDLRIITDPQSVDGEFQVTLVGLADRSDLKSLSTAIEQLIELEEIE